MPKLATGGRTRAQSRNGGEDLQLNLFGLTPPIYETTDAIRFDGRETLAGVSSENGREYSTENACNNRDDGTKIRCLPHVNRQIVSMNGGRRNEQEKDRDRDST